MHVSSTKELAQEIAAYLLDTRKTADLDSLLRDVMEYRAVHGVVEAEAVSAHQITEATIKGIEDILKREHPKAKSVRVIPRLDPSVVGGVRIDLANEQLDLSVRDRLDMFKRLTANIKE